jgi:hypothetical protein
LGVNTLLNAHATVDGIAPLTIDVATDTTTAHGVANTTFVRIGLGSLEISMASLSSDVKLGTGTATTPTLNQTLGSIYLGGMDVLVNGSSYVDIYDGRAANKQGVTLAFNVTIDDFHLNTASWTDSDGFNNAVLGSGGTVSTTSSAGSVGLIGTDITALTVLGAVTIDVATDATTAHGGVANTTFVRLGFANTQIGFDTLNTTAVLSNNAALVGTAPGTLYTLGTIYMKTLAATISGYADIYAHAVSGVNIDFAASINMTLAALSWGDTDGIAANTTGAPTGANSAGGTYTNGPLTDAYGAGYVGLTSLNITGLGLGGGVTIDVATVHAGDVASLYNTGTTFVQIGFNAVNVSMTSMTANVVMAGDKTLTTNAQTLGSVYLGGLTTAINGSLGISAAQSGGNNSGVVLNINLLSTNIHIDALSWGDADGVGTATAAGYVGLKTLDITGLTVTGLVSIDVATVDINAPQTPIQLMYAGYATHNVSPTFVHIGLGTGNADDSLANAKTLAVGMTSLATNVVLGNDAALSVNPGKLGSIYVGNMALKVNGWVDIGAH